MDGQATAKRRLREQLRARLAEVAVGEAVAWGERATAHIARQALWRDASVVALYKAIPGELDTDRLASVAWLDGKVVLLPAIEGDRLVFRRWSEGDRLFEGRFGVREPSRSTPAVPIEAADLVFVPGLGFDQRGGRLGRGAGYYDRALAGLGASAGSTPLVGLGFGLQLVDGVPMTPLDVRLDAVVTDEGWIDCA